MDPDKSDRSDKSTKSDKLEKKERKENEKREKKEAKDAAAVKKKQDKENQALQALKTKLNAASVNRPVGFDTDAALLRFLRARKCDVDKSYDMFTNCLKWREKEKPDSIALESISREVATGKSFFIGKDKLRRPTFLVFPGRHEPKAISNDETVRALLYHVELGIKQMDPDVEQLALMVDFEGWGMHNVDRDLDKMLMETIQFYYPERLGGAFVINPPAIFTVAWNIVKTFLDKRTTKKIHFLSGDDVKEVLPKHFDMDVLPKRYGGNNPITLDPPKKTAQPKGPPKSMSMKKD
jgi:hypothetical protein